MSQEGNFIGSVRHAAFDHCWYVALARTAEFLIPRRLGGMTCDPLPQATVRIMFAVARVEDAFGLIADLTAHQAVSESKEIVFPVIGLQPADYVPFL